MANHKKDKTMERWREMFSASMSAVAFAEANLPEMAMEILHDGKRQEYVLFVMQDTDLHLRAMQYATNLCHRMDCGLAVLQVLSDKRSRQQAADKLTATFKTMIDVPAVLFQVQGDLGQAVRRLVTDNRRIISVVVDDAAKNPGRNRRDPKRRPWWQELRCPVTVIPAASG